MLTLDTVEVPQTPEAEVNEFSTACNFISNKLSDSVNRKYGPDSPRPLEFHQKPHTEAVARRSDTILAIIQEVKPNLVSDRDRALAKVPASGHDIVQIGGPKDDQFAGSIKETLFRMRERNEEDSISDVQSEMRNINIGKDKAVFTPKDMQVVEEAILGTIPWWDDDLGTVTQSNVKPGCSLIAFAVARADLGSAGMDGAEAFRRDGNNEFKETKLGISKANAAQRNANPRQHKDLSDQDKEYISEQIRSWLGSQVKFASGRQALLDAETAVLGDAEVEKALKERVFNKFDESIEDAKARYEKAQSLSFEELLKEIGY